MTPDPVTMTGYYGNMENALSLSDIEADDLKMRPGLLAVQRKVNPTGVPARLDVSRYPDLIKFFDLVLAHQPGEAGRSTTMMGYQ